MQVIMELQCGSEAEAVDLSGDAGVVGRWLVQGDDEHPELRMDLKGVLFSATTVRSPAASQTCCLVAVQKFAHMPLLSAPPSLCKRLHTLRHTV